MPSPYFLLPLIWLSATANTVVREEPGGLEKFDEFDWALTKSVAATSEPNAVFSPISVKLMLGLLYEGSKGNSSKELENVLEITDKTRDLAMKKFASILKSLQTESLSYELDIGTNIFLSKKSSLIPKYEKAVKTMFNASVEKVDFTKEAETVKEINQWVEYITKGHLKNLVDKDDIDENTMMLILNAVFFSGLWEKPFPSNGTKTGDFHISPDKKVKVSYMNAVHNLKYIDCPDLEATLLQLPYMGNKFAMYLILPDKVDGIQNLMTKLKPDLLRKMKPEMESIEVHIALPKFKFDFAVNLKSILQKLGIRDIFTSNANLTGIANNPNQDLLVSNILQKAGIKINEEGSTVFAATEVELVSKFGDFVVSFKADHPFIFYIEDETTNTVVFVGKVGDPSIGLEHEKMASMIENDVLTRQPTSKPSQAEDNQQKPPSPGLNQPSSSAHAYFDYIESFAEDKYSYFDLELLQAMNKNSGNLVASPASIKSVLGMLYEAAEGNTKKQLKDALRLPRTEFLALDTLHKYQHTLMKNPGASIQWIMGNKIILNKNLNLSNAYQSAMTDHYLSPVDKEDFTQPQIVAKKVNDWANKYTHGLIPNVLKADSISPEAILMLLNAVYFKGEWRYKFDETRTQDECFFPQPKECKKVPMMYLEGKIRRGYFSNIDANILELEYTNPRYSMVLVVPSAESGLQLTMRNLPFSGLLSLVKKLSPSNTFLKMPRFTINTKQDLIPYLREVSVTDLFNANSNLDKMLATNTSAKVNKFDHLAKIIVNEQGSEASAVTIGQVIPLSLGTDRMDITINQPFLFFIKDKEAGILFYGKVVDPSLS